MCICVRSLFLVCSISSIIGCGIASVARYTSFTCYNVVGCFFPTLLFTTYFSDVLLSSGSITLWCEVILCWIVSSSSDSTSLRLGCVTELGGTVVRLAPFGTNVGLLLFPLVACMCPITVAFEFGGFLELLSCKFGECCQVSCLDCVLEGGHDGKKGMHATTQFITQWSVHRP